MSILENHESITTQGGGGYPPGGYGPPGGQPPGGWGPPGGGGGPPGGGYPPGGGGPPGGGYPPGGGGPPGGGYAPGGGGPPGGWGPPGGSPPGGYGPPGGGAPPGGGYGAPPGGGYGGGYGAPPPGSPYGGFAPPPYQPGAPIAGASGPGFEATEPIAFGWNAVMKNFGGVAVPLAVAALVAAIPNIVLSFARGIVITMLTTANSVEPAALMALNFGSLGVTYVISLIVQAYMLGGMVQFALRVCRGDRPDFGVVFGGGPFFLPLLGGTILYSLGVGAGMFLCLVPGLFLAGSWVAYSAFVVDKRMGPVAALSASWQAMAPYRTTGLVYILLSGLVAIGGFVACFVGVLLVSVPVIVIGNAYIYLKLIGEQPRLAS